MNALLRKEIRDAIRWLPLGFVLFGLLLVYACRTIYAPQLSDVLFTMVWFSSLLYGSFLSLVTFLPDERDAARAFLIHRAIAPSQIFKIRVLVGLAVYGLGMFLPLAALAVYLAALGPERLPVSPWQVVPALAAAVVGSIFYFAGIVIACRPANWFGTRLLPLAAAAGGSFMSVALLSPGPLYVTLFLYALSCASALLMAVAARHAFIRTPSQVYPTRIRSESLAMRLVLLLSSILLVGALGLLPLNLVRRMPDRYSTAEFDKDGLPIYVVRSSAANQGAASKALEKIPMIGPSEPPPEQIEISDFGDRFLFAELNTPAHNFDPRNLHSIDDRTVFFDPSGYMLVYRAHQVFGMMLELVVASDTVSLPNEPRGKPFQKIPRFLLSGAFYPQVNFNSRVPQRTEMSIPSVNHWIFATNEGLFKLDLEKRTIELLLNAKIDSLGLSIQGDAKRVAIQSGDSIHIYLSDASKPNVPPERFTLDSTLKTGSINKDGYFCYRDSENWTYLVGYASYRSFEVTRSTAGMIRRYPFAIPEETLKTLSQNRSENSLAVSVSPPLLTVGSLVFPRSFYVDNRFVGLLLSIQWVLVIASTAMVSKYRGLRPGRTAFWIALACLLGLGVPLAVLAIYPPAVHETCSACHRRRRVENLTCEHCGAHWSTLPAEGIEIIENETLEDLPAPEILRAIEQA